MFSPILLTFSALAVSVSGQIQFQGLTFPNLQPPSGVPTSYPSGSPQTGPLSTVAPLSGYPPLWKVPTTDTELQAAMKNIDWTKVPNIPPKKLVNGALDVKSYPFQTDPDCWWSASLCTTPKLAGLPPDVFTCPSPGVWGLTYDDGPLVASPQSQNMEEPHLYDTLAQHNNQRASLFYIGSNVLNAPAAAVRALANGHDLMVHTWSHQQMTTLTNDQVFAELYWTTKIIKQVTGVTAKYWRPPFGDVDDRVRAIAYQMGLHTVIWDRDTNDWGMPPGGTTPVATVDGYFTKWINQKTTGTDTAGHVVLQHELNFQTVTTAEKWLPQVQSTWTVMPVSQCMNITNPYWETNFLYPTIANPNPTPVKSGNGTTSTVSANSTASTAASSGSALLRPSYYSSPLSLLVLLVTFLFFF